MFKVREQKQIQSPPQWVRWTFISQIIHVQQINLYWNWTAKILQTAKTCHAAKLSILLSINIVMVRSVYHDIVYDYIDAEIWFVYHDIWHRYILTINISCHYDSLCTCFGLGNQTTHTFPFPESVEPEEFVPRGESRSRLTGKGAGHCQCLPNKKKKQKQHIRELGCTSYICKVSK